MIFIIFFQKKKTHFVINILTITCDLLIYQMQFDGKKTASILWRENYRIENSIYDLLLISFLGIIM